MFTKNINDFKTSKSNKLSKFFAISYQETSHAPPPPNVHRGQNRYVTLP